MGKGTGGSSGKGGGYVAGGKGKGKDGKGKGKGKGDGGKAGFYKGKSFGDGKGKGGVGFPGRCHKCGGMGHRQAECRVVWAVEGGNDWWTWQAEGGWLQEVPEEEE